MKLDPVLTKAVHLARKGNYDASIKLLENEASRYYGSFIYYYLLGLSYLYSKIFGRALSYLRLAYEQKMRDSNTLLGLAALYLNHGDTDKAVDLYLEIQTIDERNRIAKNALKIIRKFPGPEDISSWIESGRLHLLFPPFPKTDFPRKKLALGILAALAALFITFGISYKAGFFHTRGPRSLPSEISLIEEEKKTPVEAGGSYRYVLTGNQVLDAYNEALNFFSEYRDEEAKVRLNRILESNAVLPIKNKARILISYMEIPGFDTLKDRFSYSEVIKDPFVYRDCHVIWKGMASNLFVGENRTSFDLLVGYDTRRTMEGIVQVDYEFAIHVNAEFPVEILGRIIPVATEREIRIRLQGLALNQAGMLEKAQIPEVN
jgi:tetratricopeptide (TPR) repeat protein